MYEIIKNVISNKRYDLEDITKKIDTLWVQSDLTDEQKEELITLARENFDPNNKVAVLAKLAELEKKIEALQGQLTE